MEKLTTGLVTKSRLPVVLQAIGDMVAYHVLDIYIEWHKDFKLLMAE